MLYAFLFRVFTAFLYENANIVYSKNNTITIKFINQKAALHIVNTPRGFLLIYYKI